MRNKLIINIATIALVINCYGRTVLNNIPYVNFFDDVLLILLVVFLPFSKFTRKDILTKPFFLLLLLLFFSAVLNGVAFDVFLVQVRSLFLPMILIHYLLRGKNKSLGYSILKRILLVSFPVILIGLLEILSGRLFFESVDRFGQSLDNSEMFRLASTIGNPIDLGLYVLLIIGILFSDLVYKLNLLQNKFLTMAMLIGSVVVLFGTKSRGPILAIAVMLVYFVITKRIKLKYYLFSIFVAVLSYLSFGEQFLERFSTLSLDISQSEGYREIWLLQSLRVLNDYVFFGVGPGMYGGWVSINYSPSWVYSYYDINTDGISSIDMFFVHFICEAGVFGFLAYLFFYFTQFRFFRRSYKASRNSSIKGVSLMVIISIIALFVTGFTSILLESQLVLVTYSMIYSGARIIQRAGYT